MKPRILFLHILFTELLSTLFPNDGSFVFSICWLSFLCIDVCLVYMIGSLLDSSLGHCSHRVIRSILRAIVECRWGHSVLPNSDNCACCHVVRYIFRMVPSPPRSRSVVWEPSSWFCVIYCITDCSSEADGGRCSVVYVSIWQTTPTTSTTRSVCLLHLTASCRRG